jgi:hypothetical protein
VAVGNEHSDFTEHRLDADTSKRFLGSTDLDWGACVSSDTTFACEK